MNGWFLVMVVIYVLNIGVALGSHGKKREGEINFWSSLVGSLFWIWVVYMAVKTGF